MKSGGGRAGRDWRRRLRAGLVIPAHPLALDAHRKLNQRRQRALTRYYLAAGAGGLAVGVHTTQFGIRKAGLYRPVLELAADTAARYGSGTVMVAGVVGRTRRAVAEAALASRLGYHLALVSLSGWGNTGAGKMVEHIRAVTEVMPVMGFYLQPAAGGIPLESRFWSMLLELPGVVALKIAPFDRYETTRVMEAVATSGRTDVALYTGNDDHILLDLVTPYPRRRGQPLRFVGGLLGHWAFGTRTAVVQHGEARRIVQQGRPVPQEYLVQAQATTSLNAAVFDPEHRFRGCIPGIHEVLRRQGLLQGRWCLDSKERLSPGQSNKIERALAGAPLRLDDELIRDNLDEWLR